MFTLKDGEAARQYALAGVNVKQLDLRKYRGGNPARYICRTCSSRGWPLALMRRAGAGTVDVVHIHNMPNFLIVAAIVPMLREDGHSRHSRHDAGNVRGDISSKVPQAVSRDSQLEERICCALADHVICVNEYSARRC